MKPVFRPVPFARSASTLATAIAIALLGAPFDVHAQVAPATGAQRPGIDAAANGVGVVNIVAPSKAGVSHNQYNDFNVDQRGLILNNAANVSPTQLAGYVVGNPNLQPGQSARIILNEVVSTNRSALNGALEVAGNRAEVIVANPNGISVGGATFINTSRATLTTGTPVFGGDGSLNAFRVSRGAIEIAGAGLDASLTDRLDIIARNVIANGKVWANQLNVIAGTNQVERDSLATQAIAGDGMAPDVAIDVAALGGMYSNHIYLRADGANIGVRSAGELASAGGFAIDTTGQLTVTGTVIATDALAVNAGTIDNAGTMAARSVTLAGEHLDNRGTIQSTGDTAIHVSGALDQRGTLRSDARLDVQAGSVINTGTLYAAGPLALSAGAITNTGALASAADLLIRGASLQSTGTLGAGVATDGALAGSGALQVIVTGALIATGRNLAAGRMALSGSALDLSGAMTRAGSDIALTATTGDIDLHGGDLATAYGLDMRAARLLNNAAGIVQAGLLGITAGALDNRGGQLLQTGGAASTLTITGSLDNTGGRLASNAGDLTVRAGTLSNVGGAIEHAGTGTARLIVDDGIDNRSGRLLGNGGIAITSGGALTNARGTVSAAREAALHLGALDNADGTVIAQTLTVLAQGDIANSGGTLQAAQALSLSAANLINGTGQVKALDGTLNLSLTQTLSNAAGGFVGGNAAVMIGAGALANAGQIYAGNDLALTSQGSLANTGALQAMGSATIGAGAVDNRGGRIEAGSGRTDATFSLTAGSLDNTGGRLAHAATGATSVNVSGALINTAGTLGGQGDLTLTANMIDNTGASTLVAGRDLTLFTGYLDNSGGTLYAARHLGWSNGAATLVNRQGQVGAGGNAALTLAALDNTGGETAANGDVTLALGHLTGTGRVVAGNDLAIRLPGDYTNLVGNVLQANRSFRFDLGGRFVNAAGAVLDAVQGLAVHAAAIDNAGLLNSAATTLTAAGDLTNTGRIEGDTLDIRATNLINTGTLIGGAITVHAANLTNGADLGDAVDNASYQSALIAATDRVALYIGGTLLNRDALIYSMGNIVIAADEGGARSAALINRSGSIEADGTITLAATRITNERRVLETERHVLDANEQAANTTVGAPWVRYREDDPDPLHHPPYVLPEQMISAEELALAHAYCAGNHQDNYRCVGYDFGDFVNGRPISFNAVTTSVVTAVTRLKRASAEGRILAGGDMVLSGSVLNDSSTIAAGRNLSINGQAGGMGDGTQIIGGETVRNLSFVPTAEITDTTRYGVQYQYLKHTDDGHTWIWDGFEIYRSGSTSTTLGLGAPPAWITLDPGGGLSARISAGGGLTIVGTDIQNTTVDANGTPVAGVGLGSNAGGKPVAGAGPAPGAQLVGDATHPIGAITVPTGGLYTVHPGTGAGYLIETDLRFASQSGFLGSDYLMNRLGFNGESLLKRLGDAFYETRLVLDQITSLTGRRYLDGNSDATAQYRALMDSGVAAAGKFDLAVGVALTPEQMASLTTDIVWMVNQEVNGESVLVPVVYLSAATANNVASGASLSGTTVALDASGTLTNGGTITATQDASLKAGTLLNAGQVAANGSLSLSAAQDLLNSGAIQGGNVALVAGRDLTSGGSLTATGDLGLTAGRDLGLNRVALNAGKDLTLAAGRDLTATASALSAGGDAQLSAGRDLALNAIGHTQAVDGNIAKGESTTHDVTGLTVGGSAVLAAGRDLSSQGADLKAGNVLAVSAGRDISLDAVTDRVITQTNSIGHGIVHAQAMDETLRGTALDGTNGVIVSAGRDLTTTAATITSDTGGIALAAGRDVNLNAGIETHTWEQTSKTKKSGTLSSKTTKTYDATEDKLAIGTLLSGDSVTVAAGRDLTTQAAQIGATNDVVLAAGNNLTIGTATSTHSEAHDKTVTQSGLMSGGGFSVMLGQSKEKQGYEQTDTTPTGSLIGSTDGRVTLSAGNDVHITGSDILSQTGTAIVGKNVTIDAAVGTTDTRQTYKKQSAGISLGLSGGVVSAAEAAYGASKRGSQVKDDRLKALYAAQAAYAVSDGYQAATAAGTSGDAGVSLRIGVGASSASSETKTHDETAYGSRIHSKGDIAIAATGGDLNIIGSQVDGTNVALAAANNINLLSQEELHSSKSTNRNGSGEIGFSIGSQTGFYVTASAGRGKGAGNGITHAETTIGASDTLTLVSGNDTTIKGAQLTGNQVIAAIGGNLRIESEQDTDDYASKQQQVGGTFVYGYGGSVSYNQDKVNSHYTSVNEVSGISAGSGGFQIAVGGNTHLKGGVIASTAEPSKNLLNTGSLTWENIRNEANYSASSVGLSGGYSSGKASDDGAPNPFGSEGYRASPGMLVPQKGHSSSETLAGIANGTIVVRDGPVDLSGLDRAPSLDSQALKGIFDEQKIREQLELGKVAGQVGFRAAGDLAGQMGWAEGSKERTVLHGVVGAAVAGLGGGNALQGGLGAATNQYAIPAMAQYLADQGYDPRSPEFSSMLELGSTALGAAVGGGAGAATALDGTRYNYLKHNELRQVKKDLQNCLTRGGDVSACQGQVLVDAKLLSQANDIALYLTCTGDSGCKANDIRTATQYVVDQTVPSGLKEDQARGTGVLLTSLFSNDDGYKFYPELSDREAFFQALQNGTEIKGGQTVWPQVAAQTSDSLQDVNSVICLFCGGASAWVNQVGTTIMKNEWSEFQSLYKGPALKGAAAQQWDTNMLLQEQKMLQPMYEQLNGGGVWREIVIKTGGFFNTWGNISKEDNRNEYGQGRLDDVRKDKGW